MMKRAAIAILAGLSVAPAKAQQVYYSNPPGGTIDGSEIVGPIRQRGQNVTLTLGAITPLRSVAGLTGNPTPQQLQTALGLGTAAYQPAGSFSGLGADGKVLAASLVSRPVVTPQTTTIGTTPTTIYLPGSTLPNLSYYSITMVNLTSSMTCRGDGVMPTNGAAGYTAVAGQPLFWPPVPGGAIPVQAVVCVAPVISTITTEAH